MSFNVKRGVPGRGASMRLVGLAMAGSGLLVMAYAGQLGLDGPLDIRQAFGVVGVVDVVGVLMTSLGLYGVMRPLRLSNMIRQGAHVVYQAMARCRPLSFPVGTMLVACIALLLAATPYVFSFMDAGISIFSLSPAVGLMAATLAIASLVVTRGKFLFWDIPSVLVGMGVIVHYGSYAAHGMSC